MPLQNGQTLGHYRILRPLGAGGMGEVYEAEDTKLGRKVALKVLPEETARDPQRRERFEREAKAVAALSHPGIVTIHSVEQADGVDFITMELLDGQTLRKILPRTGMPFERFLAIAVPLAEAMGAAHERGITHRDLKPENILIGRDGRLKVVDFGLAKRDDPFGVGGEGSHAPTRALTEEGRIVGTVAYMSPEQAEGKPVDPRSDVFTLGIILYEMAAGERPFRGDTTVSVLSSILKDTPPPVTQANATLPRDVARIVNRCLMKDPARRFQSAVGLATELLELKHESDSGGLAAFTGEIRRPGVGATTTSPSVAAAPGAGRAGGAGGALRHGAIAAAVLVVGAAGYFVLRGRSGAPTLALPEAPGAAVGGAGTAVLPGPGALRPSAADTRQRIVVLPFENLGAPDDAYFADGMTEEINSRLASVSGLGVISRPSAMQYAKTTKSTRQIGAELNVDYVLAGTVRWQRGSGGSRVRVTPQLVRVSDDTQLWGDRYDRDMKDIFKVQSEIAEQVVGKLGLAMRSGGSPVSGGSPPTKNLDAYQTYLRGKALAESPDADRESFLKAVGLLEEAVGLDPTFAQGWAELSQQHSSIYLNKIDFSEERLVKARGCVDRALALQPNLREAHLALGYYYYWGRRDYAQAAAEFGIAAGGRDDDPEVLAAMGYMMRRQGKWDEALAALEKAYALNPRDFQLIGILVETYQAMWRYPEAMRLVDLTMELSGGAVGVKVGKAFLLIEMDGNTHRAREQLASIDPREFPPLPGILTIFDTMDGRFPEALVHLKAYPSDIVDMPGFYSTKSLQEGLIYLAMNDRARAQPPCESARQHLEKQVAANPRDPRTRSSLGLALACLGRREEAVREARLAVDLEPVSTDAVNGPGNLNGLASVYAVLGDSEAAIDVLEKYMLLPGSTSPALLRIEPLFAPLRKNPRFQKLLEIRH